MDVVQRRVLEEDESRRELDARLDELEDAALARRVGGRIDQARLDVVEARQREEVVVLVVVERRLVAQALPGRIRVVVDLDVVRVVVRLIARHRSVGHVRHTCSRVTKCLRS